MGNKLPSNEIGAEQAFRGGRRTVIYNSKSTFLTKMWSVYGQSVAYTPAVINESKTNTESVPAVSSGANHTGLNVDFIREIVSREAKSNEPAA